MKYSGTVIDDIHGGEFHECDDMFLHIYRRMETPISVELDASIPLEKTLCTIDVYKNYVMHFADDQGNKTTFGYWVPVEVKEPGVYVLKELNRRYRKR